MVWTIPTIWLLISLAILSSLQFQPNPVAVLGIYWLWLRDFWRSPIKKAWIWIRFPCSSFLDMNFRSLEEFWPFYVSQHSKPSTRRWHFVGTLTSMVFLLCSLFFSWWFLFLVPLFGYGCAWYSHFFVEGNVPATFGHPFWSLCCDYKMFGLMLTGNMDREIKRLGKRPVLQVL